MLKITTVWCPNETIEFTDDCGGRAPVGVFTGVYRNQTRILGNLVKDEVDEWKTLLHHKQEASAERCRQSETQIVTTDDFEATAQSLLNNGIDGIVATVSNTFDNGYTSIWNYKVQDGVLMVQKPQGNQARAEFSSVDEMGTDFHRYLSYGFTLE